MNKPIAKLGDYMPKEIKRKTRDFNLVPVNWVKKLAQASGSDKAAALKLGITQTPISTILKDGKTRVVNELAAELVYKKNFGADPSSEVTAIVTASPHVIKTINDIVKAAGGHVYKVPVKS